MQQYENTKHVSTSSAHGLPFAGKAEMARGARQPGPRPEGCPWGPPKGLAWGAGGEGRSVGHKRAPQQSHAGSSGKVPLFHCIARRVTSCTMCSAPCIMHDASCVAYHVPCIMYRMSCTMCYVSHTLTTPPAEKKSKRIFECKSDLETRGTPSAALPSSSRSVGFPAGFRLPGLAGTPPGAGCSAVAETSAAARSSCAARRGASRRLARHARRAA